MAVATSLELRSKPQSGCFWWPDGPRKPHEGDVATAMLGWMAAWYFLLFWVSCVVSGAGNT